MATKVSGLGDNFYVGGYDLSGATNSLGTIQGSVNPLDFTDITQSAFSRLGGERDGTIQWVSYLDVAAGNSAHALLSSLPTTDVIASYFRGTAIGNDSACMTAKQIDYNPTRAADGMLTFAVNAQANGFGLEWGKQLTPGIRTDTSATAGSFYDNGAGFAFGAQAYLQAFSFSGTDVTVSVTHCTTSGGSYSNLITFPQIISGNLPPLAARATVSNVTTVNEFLKVTTTTTGGFTSLAFACVVVVNRIAGQVF